MEARYRSHLYSALRALGLQDRHRVGRLRENNRAEIRICRSEGESKRCLGSSPCPRRKASSRLMLRSTCLRLSTATHQPAEPATPPCTGGLCLGEGCRLSAVVRLGPDSATTSLVSVPDVYFRTCELLLECGRR